MQITVEHNIPADVRKPRKVWDSLEPDRNLNRGEKLLHPITVVVTCLKVFRHWEHVFEYHACFVYETTGLATDRSPVQGALRAYKISDTNKGAPVSATCSANERRRSTLVNQLL